MVVRKVPDDNRRSIDLYLTEKGQKRLDRLHSHQIAFLDQALKDVSEDEKKISTKVLRNILDYANAFPKDQLTRHFSTIHKINHN
ncbi:MAG: hypothetical protein E4G98_04330 [Promethearchaeota archaeon]|nr:MAG: hypothetical protein E4G98_04330 [Candidatus Lokiarchaeota archaeon]